MDDTHVSVPIENDVQEDGEGNVIIDGAPSAVSSEQTEDHYSNLAQDLDISVRLRIGQDLAEAVARDVESRQEWFEGYVRGFDLLGLDRSDDETDDPFPGASRVVHPVLMQSTVDFAARAIKELFPATGPVREHIWGQQTPERVQRAARKREYMNWQLTQQVREARDEMDAMLIQLPLVGSGIKKVYWDHLLDRPRCEYVHPEDFIVPYSAASIETAPRYTHRLRLSKMDLEDCVDAGLYADIDYGRPDAEDRTLIEDKIDKIEGKSPSQDDDDERHTLFEVYTRMKIDELGDERAVPYVITIHLRTRQVVGLRRNWKFDDDKKRPIYSFAHYKFLPWRGFYGLGLIHCIGGLAKAATGAMRALLDAAQIDNIPGGIRMKGLGVSGGITNYAPMQFSEIEWNGGPADDIRKLIMPYPTKGPSATLADLLKFTVEAAGTFANVTTAPIQDATNNGPVGTTLALIEQGAQVYSAIHARCHHAQARELEILADLNGLHLNDQETKKTFGGEVLAYRADFEDNDDIAPVSDPNIFSDAQRFAQVQTIAQLKQAFPGAGIDDRQAVTVALQAMRFKGTDQILAPVPPQPPQPMPLDPVSELMALTKGIPVQAFPGQMHQAHIAVLMQFGASQGPKSPIMQMIGPRWASLVSDHTTMMLADQVNQFLAQHGAPPWQPGTPLPPPMAAQLAMVQAQIAQMLPAAQPEPAQGGGDDLQKKMAFEQFKSGLEAQDDARRNQIQAENDERDHQRELQRQEFERQSQMAETQREMLGIHRDAQESQNDAELERLRLQMETRKADLDRESRDRAAMVPIITTAMKINNSDRVQGPVGEIGIQEDGGNG
jgi:hypothetical protein